MSNSLNLSQQYSVIYIKEYQRSYLGFALPSIAALLRILLVSLSWTSPICKDVLLIVQSSTAVIYNILLVVNVLLKVLSTTIH